MSALQDRTWNWFRGGKCAQKTVWITKRITEGKRGAGPPSVPLPSLTSQASGGYIGYKCLESTVTRLTRTATSIIEAFANPNAHVLEDRTDSHCYLPQSSAILKMSHHDTCGKITHRWDASLQLATLYYLITHPKNSMNTQLEYPHVSPPPHET